MHTVVLAFEIARPRHCVSFSFFILICWHFRHRLPATQRVRPMVRMQSLNRNAYCVHFSNIIVMRFVCAFFVSFLFAQSLSLSVYCTAAERRFSTYVPWNIDWLIEFKWTLFHSKGIKVRMDENDSDDGSKREKNEMEKCVGCLFIFQRKIENSLNSLHLHYG